jgi:hypothetical protein
MANSSNKIKKQNLKKKNDEENNEDSSQNEEESNEETEQTEGDNISEADDQESVTENDTESEGKNNNNKKVKPLKGENEEDSKKTTNSDPEKLDSEEESEEESKKLDDEESDKEDAKEIAEEETLSKETSDNTDDNDADIDLLLTKSQAEVTEDYIAATGDFLYFLHNFCVFALENEESEHEQQKIQDLIDQINSLLPHFPTSIHIGDYSSIDPEKIQDFLDKYSDLIKNYLAVQTKVLQANLLGTKTELMQQVSVLAYTISTKLPDRDEVTENLRLAAAKLSYYCARYVITTSIKSFVQKLDYVPAIVKLAKDFIRDTIKLIQDPSTMTQKLLSNYLKNLDSNMNNLSVIFDKSNNKLSAQQDAKKDIVMVRTKKADNFGAISTIAIKTFLSSGAILSLIGKKIDNSIDQKNIPQKHSKHHPSLQNYGAKILQDRAQTKNKVKTRG